MTYDQLGACVALGKQGYRSVSLPGLAVPGHILMANPEGNILLLVKGDGTAVDLFEVHRLAEDCIRNWNEGGSLPKFVGDFKRLTELAKALNGRKPA